MKNAIKRLFVFLMIVFAIVVMLPVTSEAKAASLSKSSLTIVKGTSYTIKVKNGKTKSFSSAKSKIASVNKKGKITAKKKGTTYIKVKVGKKTLKCKVNVIEGRLDKKSISLKAGNVFS